MTEQKTINHKTTMIKTEQKTITPEWAATILDRHYKRLTRGEFKQRPITETVINRYASDIKHGFWKLSPQPISFDENDDLIDGQHRLEAVRKTGIPTEMMVSTGWPVDQAKNNAPKLIDVLDTGKPRSVAQMMHLHGVSSANNYATTTRFIARVALNGSNPVLTFSGASYILDKLNLRSNIDRIISQTISTRDFKGKTVGPLAFYHTSHPQKAMAFAEGLFNHTAEKGSAIHTYFKWRDSAHGTTHTDIHLKGFCACLRAWHNNQSLSVVRLNTEAVEWLSSTNPKLRDQIRSIAPRT